MHHEAEFSDEGECCPLKRLNHTINITPTSAANGINLMRGHSNTTKPTKPPAMIPDKRPRPPEVILITLADHSATTHAFEKPETILPIPLKIHS